MIRNWYLDQIRDGLHVLKTRQKPSCSPKEYTTQSGFSTTRDSPHTHFPPSPRAPIRSSSCGQLNAGGKKSPAPQSSSKYFQTNGNRAGHTDSVRRPWIL